MTSYRISDEKAAFRRLWQQVFGDEEAWIDRFFASIPGLVSWGAFESGALVSAFHLIPCRLMGQAQKLRGYYLYAAATDPAFRSRGLMASLLQKAAKACQEEDFDFLCLFPAEESLYAYYARSGFRVILQSARYEQMDPALVRRFPDAAAWKHGREASFSGQYISFDEQVYRFLLQEDPNAAVFPDTGADGCFFLPLPDAEKAGGVYVVQKGGMLLPLSERIQTNTKPIYLGLTME